MTGYQNTNIEAALELGEELLSKKDVAEIQWRDVVQQIIRLLTPPHLKPSSSSSSTTSSDDTLITDHRKESRQEELTEFENKATLLEKQLFAAMKTELDAKVAHAECNIQDTALFPVVLEYTRENEKEIRVLGYDEMSPNERFDSRNYGFQVLGSALSTLYNAHYHVSSETQRVEIDFAPVGDKKKRKHA